MARLRFQKAHDSTDTKHILTIKEARYIRKFKNHRWISIILGSIAIIELVLLIHRGI